MTGINTLIHLSNFKINVAYRLQFRIEIVTCQAHPALVKQVQWSVRLFQFFGSLRGNVGENQRGAST